MDIESKKNKARGTFDKYSQKGQIMIYPLIYG